MEVQLEKKRTLLSQAVDELTLKTKSLRMEKEELEEQLDTLIKDMSDTQSEENVLRVKITKLLEKEERLSIKKKETHSKLSELQEKISKIIRVSGELKEMNSEENPQKNVVEKNPVKKSSEKDEGFLQRMRKKFSA